MEKIFSIFIGFGLWSLLFSVGHTSVCPLREFTCDNNDCVPYIHRCDGDNDCRDYSDERCEPYLDHFLLVADFGRNKDLYQIDLNTNVLLPLKVGDFNIDALAFDDRNGDVYWTDFKNNTIERYSLTGNRRAETIFNATGTLGGLALDLDGDRLYYCGVVNSGGRERGLIGQMSMNGNDHRIIVSDEGARPRSIVLDTVSRLMYWIDDGSRPSIFRAQMDNGSEKEVIVRSNIMAPMALAIDTKEQLLYWGDAGFHRIERLNLTAEGDRLVILDEKARNASYWAFALSPEFLYLTDRKQGSLRKLNLRSGKVFEQLPEEAFTRLNGVVYYNSYGSTPLFRTSLVTASIDYQNTSANHTVSSHFPLEIQPTSNESSVAKVITVVAGVVVVTIVITVGVVLVKARRTRKMLLLEKRLVAPPTERGDNSYFDGPSRGANGSAAAAAAAGGSSSLFFFSANPFFRMAVTRSSSFKPIIGEDVLQTNNVYSTVAGDYENVDTYEIIEDPLV